MNWYHYEQDDTTTKDIPYPHCEVLTLKRSNDSDGRGIAFASNWIGMTNSTLWMNSLNSGQWRGWAKPNICTTYSGIPSSDVLKNAYILLIGLNIVGTQSLFSTYLDTYTSYTQAEGLVWDGNRVWRSLIEVRWDRTNGTLSATKEWSEGMYDTPQVYSVTVFS